MYIENILTLTEGDWTYHVQKLELTLNKLKGKWPKCNIEKSFFGQTKMEYLRLWVTCDGIKHTTRKIEAIQNMNPTTSRKEVRKFIGIVNYYLNMWSKC